MREKETTAGIDAWVRQVLTQRYDATLDEPIPSELLCLLEQS